MRLHFYSGGREACSIAVDHLHLTSTDRNLFVCSLHFGHRDSLCFKEFWCAIEISWCIFSRVSWQSWDVWVMGNCFWIVSLSIHYQIYFKYARDITKGVILYIFWENREFNVLYSNTVTGSPSSPVLFTVLLMELAFSVYVWESRVVLINFHVQIPIYKSPWILSYR